MIKVDGYKEYESASITAKRVREELKENFKGKKFKVSSSEKTGTVNVEWEGRPSIEVVKYVLGGYLSGLYEIGGIKYDGGVVRLYGGKDTVKDEEYEGISIGELRYKEEEVVKELKEEGYKDDLKLREIYQIEVKRQKVSGEWLGVKERVKNVVKSVYSKGGYKKYKTTNKLKEIGVDDKNGVIVTKNEEISIVRELGKELIKEKRRDKVESTKIKEKVDIKELVREYKDSKKIVLEEEFSNNIGWEIDEGIIKGCENRLQREIRTVVKKVINGIKEELGIREVESIDIRAMSKYVESYGYKLDERKVMTEIESGWGEEEVEGYIRREIRNVNKGVEYANSLEEIKLSGYREELEKVLNELKEELGIADEVEELYKKVSKEYNKQRGVKGVVGGKKLKKVLEESIIKSERQGFLIQGTVRKINKERVYIKGTKYENQIRERVRGIIGDGKIKEEDKWRDAEYICAVNKLILGYEELEVIGGYLRYIKGKYDIMEEYSEEEKAVLREYIDILEEVGESKGIKVRGKIREKYFRGEELSIEGERIIRGLKEDKTKGKNVLQKEAIEIYKMSDVELSVSDRNLNYMESYLKGLGGGNVGDNWMIISIYKGDIKRGRVYKTGKYAGKDIRYGSKEAIEEMYLRENIGVMLEEFREKIRGLKEEGKLEGIRIAIMEARGKSKLTEEEDEKYKIYAEYVSNKGYRYKEIRGLNSLVITNIEGIGAVEIEVNPNYVVDIKNEQLYIDKTGILIGYLRGMGKEGVSELKQRQLGDSYREAVGELQVLVRLSKKELEGIRGGVIEGEGTDDIDIELLEEDKRRVYRLSELYAGISKEEKPKNLKVSSFINEGEVYGNLIVIGNKGILLSSKVIMDMESGKVYKKIVGESLIEELVQGLMEVYKELIKSPKKYGLSKKELMELMGYVRGMVMQTYDLRKVVKDRNGNKV